MTTSRFLYVVSALSVISLAMSIINIFTDERILMVVTFAFSIISLLNVLFVVFFNRKTYLHRVYDGRCRASDFFYRQRNS